MYIMEMKLVCASKLQSKEADIRERVLHQCSGLKELIRIRDADAGELYLPIDKSEGAPSVESQKADPDSLYHVVKSVLRLPSGEIPAGRWGI